MRVFLTLSLVLSLFGCGSDSRVVTRDGGPDPDLGGGAETGMIDGNTPELPPAEDTCQKMDILFVVDDSGSMAEEQGNLATNFPRFVEVLNEFRTDAGNPLDYRVAVTTTGKDLTTEIVFGLPGQPPQSMTIMEDGPSGRLLQPAECGMTQPWIDSVDPDVTGKFSCLANVGTSGSGTEMPLLMTQFAVADRVADNSNRAFFRNDALLAVIILTDEDDCSRPEDTLRLEVDFSNPVAGADICNADAPTITPIGQVLAALDSAKGDRGRWAMSVIAGPGPGTCSSRFGDATEATRLQEFVRQAGENAVFSSICDGDLAGSLETALNTFNVACQNFPPLI
ncbi:MAG: hypothetical protein AAF645_13200 [Myxococcota bacterium]